jgi:hypothetical protein
MRIYLFIYTLKMVNSLATEWALFGVLEQFGAIVAETQMATGHTQELALLR